MTEKKDIHFLVPIELFEEFHRLFPGRGEKTGFLIRVIEKSVRMGKLKSDFADRVLDRLELEGGEE